MLNDAGYGALNGGALNEIAINDDGGGVSTSQTVWRPASAARQPQHRFGGVPLSLRDVVVSFPAGRGTTISLRDRPPHYIHPARMGSPSVMANVNFYIKGFIVQ